MPAQKAQKRGRNAAADVKAPAAKRAKKEAEKPAKKAKKAPKVKEVDPVEEKTEEVKSAFIVHSERITDSENKLELLNDMSQHCFKVVIEARPDFHTRCVGMVEETLLEIESSLKKSTAEQADIIATGATTEATMNAEITELEGQMEAKEADIETKTATYDQHNAEWNTALNEKQDADSILENTTCEKADEETTLEKVKTGFEKFSSWVAEGGPAANREGKKEVEGMGKLLASMGADKSMVSAMPSSLDLPEGGRGAFPTMCLEQVSNLFSNSITKHEANIAEFTTNAATQTEILAQKVSVEAAAKTVEETSDDALKIAKDELKALKSEKTQKNKDLKKHKADVENAEGVKAACEEEESTFAKVFEAFVWLKERTDIKPEEPVEEEAPVEEEVVDNSGDVEMNDAEEPVAEAAEEEAAPAEEEPVAEETAPVVEEEAAPVEEEAAPVEEEAAPVEEEAAPVEEEAAPVEEEAKEETPAVEEAAAPVDETPAEPEVPQAPAAPAAPAQNWNNGYNQGYQNQGYNQGYQNYNQGGNWNNRW